MTDEIERLRGEVKVLHETIGEIDRQHNAEIEKLRAEIERLREAHAFAIRVVDVMNKKKGGPARWSEPPEV